MSTRGQILLAVIVAAVVGAAAYLAGASGRSQATVTVTQTAAVTVTAAAQRPLLDVLFSNGTFFQRCIYCGMQDVPQAQALGTSVLVLFADGRAALAEDIGEAFMVRILPPERWPLLARLGVEAGSLKVLKVLVQDHHAAHEGVLAYVDAEKAYYVVNSRHHTPMGTCVLAFASQDDARESNSTVYTFDQMLQLFREAYQRTGRMPQWCSGSSEGHGGHSH